MLKKWSGNSKFSYNYVFLTILNKNNFEKLSVSPERTTMQNSETTRLVLMILSNVILWRFPSWSYFKKTHDLPFRRYSVYAWFYLEKNLKNSLTDINEFGIHMRVITQLKRYLHGKKSVNSVTLKWYVTHENEKKEKNCDMAPSSCSKIHSTLESILLKHLAFIFIWTLKNLLTLSPDSPARSEKFQNHRRKCLSKSPFGVGKEREK